jgi:hypothetical protein
MDQKILDALLETITPLQETETYVKVLLYGEAGVGKTVLACNFGEKVILVDSAEGWVSLINHPEVEKKVQRIQYQGLSQLDAICDAIIEGHLVCDTLVLDEASGIAVLDLDTVLKARSDKDASKDPNIPTQPDFFSNTERIRRAMSRILRLPCNVVLVSHQREDRDERTGRTFIRPAFTPKTRQSIVQLCHLVGHLTANELTDEDGTTYVRKLQVQPTAVITAKSRIGGLPTVIDNPDFNTMFASWQDRITDGISDIVQEPDAVVAESVNEDESISIGE